MWDRFNGKWEREGGLPVPAAEAQGGSVTSHSNRGLRTNPRISGTDFDRLISYEVRERSVTELGPTIHNKNITGGWPITGIVNVRSGDDWLYVNVSRLLKRETLQHTDILKPIPEHDIVGNPQYIIHKYFSRRQDHYSYITRNKQDVDTTYCRLSKIDTFPLLGVSMFKQRSINSPWFNALPESMKTLDLSKF